MPTLPKNTFAEWRKKYKDLSVVRRLKSGKEADVWLVRASGRLCTLKVYSGSYLRSRSQYTEGQWINEASLRKAVRQKTKVGKDLQQKLWTKREYYLLKKLHEQDAHVPQAYAHTDEAILMEYIGDENAAAPRLIDVSLNQEAKKSARKTIEHDLQILLRNGVVHADLSAYNILWWNGQPWIIDFPQAVDVRHNPNWKALYERDVTNVRKYFERMP